LDGDVQVGCVAALLDAGAHVQCINAATGHSPLHAAAAADRQETVEVLVGAGADCNAKGLSGETPLLVAARAQAYRATAELLQPGVSES
jgi:ankyrin repeat protein